MKAGVADCDVLTHTCIALSLSYTTAPPHCYTTFKHRSHISTAKLKSDAKVQQYDFALKNQDKMDLPSKKLVVIMTALKQQHAQHFEGCGVAFDGRAIVCKLYKCWHVHIYLTSSITYMLV